MRHCFAISAYGDSPYLEDCLRSLKAQTAGDACIIICTSTPDAFIEGLAAKYGVPYYARNGASSLRDDWNFAVETAVREMKAELVTVAHQDDFYHPDYLKALKAACRIYPDLSVFCTRYRTINAASEPVRGTAEAVKRILRLPLRLRRLADRTLIKRSALIFGNSIGCPTCTYNVTRTGLPVFCNDYHFVIDWETLWRLGGMPGRFVCLEKELLDYRVHDQAETKKNIKNHVREQEEQEMYERIWPRPVARFLMHFYKKAYAAYD